MLNITVIVNNGKEVTSKTQHALTMKTLLLQTLFSQNVNNIRHYAVIDLELVSGNGLDDGSLPRLQFWSAMFGRG